MRAIRLLSLFFGLSALASAYSVLTHEAIIDAMWDHNIVPILRAKYPDITPEQLKDAHSYAYGGCLVPDMGYYPFSSKLFSDLQHYVRTGHFVANALRDARDPNELAFSIGLLAHYIADNSGHPAGVNPAEVMIYPKLRALFGNSVTYEDDPGKHLRTEFGFDVVEVAHQKYAPSAYHDFIGFHISTRLLEQAFRETYGLNLKDVIGNYDLAVGTFRKSVSAIIPQMTKVAWETKRKDIEELSPRITRSQFLYRLTRVSYDKEWGTEYHRPGVGSKILAFVFRLMPKVGPLRAFAFRPPTPQAEKLFEKSLDSTSKEYVVALSRLHDGTLELRDENYDIGEPSSPGIYRLADETWLKLLDRHAKKGFRDVSPELRDNLLAYLRNVESLSTITKQDERQRAALELRQLQSAPPTGSNAVQRAGSGE